MFNNIDYKTFSKICDMLFTYHDLIISSYKKLNEFYNSGYCPKAIQDDIKDVLEQDIYICEIDLNKILFI